MRNTSADQRGTWATFAKAARVGARMSQVELARRLGVDRVTIWRWETGKQKPEDLATAQVFATVLALDVDEVLAAAGLKLGAVAPAEPTRERDDEMELILGARVDDRTKQLMIERLLELRERDKQRRIDEIQFIIKRDRSA